LGRGNDPAVLDECRGAVVIKGRNAKDAHRSLLRQVCRAIAVGFSAGWRRGIQ
jgi:hypothetical protein